MAVVKKINELTEDFAGMKVPVKVHVDVETKEFEVEVGVPSVAALLAKEARIEKGSGKPGREFVADIPMEKIVKIATMKFGHTTAKSLKGVVKEVLGTCVSVGVKVEGKDPREVIKEVNEGVWDHVIKEG